MSEKPTGGIDLGTTNSCIAVWWNGKVKVIPNKHKENTTPSCVSFSNECAHAFVGNAAIAQQAENPKNTILETKRVIGGKSKAIQNELQLTPYSMTAGAQPKYDIQFGNVRKYVSPEEVSAIILKQLKDDAEAFLQQKVNLLAKRD